jgi:hypothetical protein
MGSEDGKSIELLEFDAIVCSYVYFCMNMYNLHYLVAGLNAVLKPWYPVHREHQGLFEEISDIYSAMCAPVATRRQTEANRKGFIRPPVLLLS